jgi:hypothetical protein
MGKARDASKERYWRELIGRQHEGGETVARFCAREGVSVDRFYWWKRTLKTASRRSRPGHGRSAASHVRAGEGNQATQSFVPVRLPFSTPASPIELVHPDGWVVRVPAGFDPQSLCQILATLEPVALKAGED